MVSYAPKNKPKDFQIDPNAPPVRSRASTKPATQVASAKPKPAVKPAVKPAAKPVVSPSKPAAAVSPVDTRNQSWGEMDPRANAIAQAKIDHDMEARYAALVENNPNDPRSSKYRASGSGAATDPSAAANNAISTLFQQYNQPEDNTLMNQLQGFSNQAQTTGAGAINDLQALLSSQQNPYAQQVVAPSVGANPMAEYMKATGASTNQVDALRNMLQGQNNDRASAANTMMGQLGQSWQNAQQGRQADAATSGAAFKQQLGDQQAGMQSQLQAQQKKQKDALMQKILEMAISNGVDLGSLGVKF